MPNTGNNPNAFQLVVGKISSIAFIQWNTAAAAAAKSLQSCLTLCTPRDGSPPGSPSLGFSSQEHWSGLPFPSPMHESEKSKWSHPVVSDSSRPHGLQPTSLLRPWDFPGKRTGVGCHHLLLNGILLSNNKWTILTYNSLDESQNTLYWEKLEKATFYIVPFI